MPGKPKFVVLIEFDTAQADRFELMHRVRNYGEDLWHAFRENPRIIVEFDVIDAAWDRLHFTVTSELLAKRASKVAEDLLRKANLVASVSIPSCARGNGSKLV